MRLVFDTDVIVAAMRSPSGASAAIVGLALKGEITLLANVGLAVEYEAVLKRPEHRIAAGLSTDEVETFINGVIAILTPVPTHFVWRPQLRDPNDEMVLEAAINGSADAIVTFNQRDFKNMDRLFRLKVVPPRIALNLFFKLTGKNND